MINQIYKFKAESESEQINKKLIDKNEKLFNNVYNQLKAVAKNSIEVEILALISTDWSSSFQPFDNSDTGLLKSRIDLKNKYIFYQLSEDNCFICYRFDSIILTNFHILSVHFIYQGIATVEVKNLRP